MRRPARLFVEEADVLLADVVEMAKAETEEVVQGLAQATHRKSTEFRAVR